MGEFTVAALTGMVGVAPGTILSIHFAYKNNWSFELFDVIQIIIFFVFATSFILQRNIGARLSFDLLRELKGKYFLRELTLNFSNDFPPPAPS